MKVWFVTIVQLIMDVLKQLFPSCLVAWKPNLQMSLEHENSS